MKRSQGTPSKPLYAPKPAKFARKQDYKPPPTEGVGVAPADPDFDFVAARIPVETANSWSRPAPEDAVRDALAAGAADFDFQVVTCKAAYVPGQSSPHAAWAGKGRVPVMRLDGVTSAGQSVRVNVWNFAPYLFINAPLDREGADPAALADELFSGIDRFLVREQKKKWGRGGNDDGGGVSTELEGRADDTDHPDADLFFSRGGRGRVAVDDAPLDVEEAVQKAEAAAERSKWARFKGASADADASASGWLNGEQVAADSLFGTEGADVDLTFQDSGSAAHRAAAERRARPENPLVIGVAPVRYKPADHFQAQDQLFFQVGLRTPNLITLLRDAIGDSPDAGFGFSPKLRVRGPTYESGVRFENRFMLDHDIVGTGWATLPAGAYALREEHAQSSRCQLEFDVDTAAIRGHTPTSNPAMYARPSGIRIMSYDIECVAPGCFPQAERHLVSNIHAVVWAMDKPDELIADVAFVLGSAAAVGDVGGGGSTGGSGRIVTACFQNERDLINAFGVFRILTDPDIITGYNITNFDEPYLVTRAGVVGAAQFLQSTRSLDTPITGRMEQFHSKNTGNSERWVGQNAGRVYIDMLLYARNNMMQKLRSYALNAVAAEILKDQKEEVDYTQIPILFEGDMNTRKRLADYCRKDALLPRALMIKLSALVAMFEQTRVQRVQLDQQQNGGASFKVFAQLLAKFRAAGFIVPYVRDQQKMDYQGATVLDPERGYYCDEPVAVEDFGSLYPSIAVAHNLCITTHVLDKDVPAVLAHFGVGAQYAPAVAALADAKRAVTGEEVAAKVAELEQLIAALTAEVKRIENSVLYRCPAGHAYVRKEHCEGIFPKMLAELLALRGEAKKLVAAAATALERDVRTQREVALKVSANSGYGFHGLPSNGTYWWWIAESITARGREQIAMSKRLIEERFTRANGYPGDARVIYGDTDSVMILFGLKIADRADKAAVAEAIGRAMALGEEAGRYCTAEFDKPNTLNFENVYFPYLLLNKKRYAGQVWAKPRDPSKPLAPEPKMKIKGMESVRRDNCRHVARTQERCLNILLRDVDPDKALTYAQAQIRRLLEGQVDFHDLVISGQLSKYFADYKTPQSHAYVRELMEKRNPGTGPKIGDRVPYVLIARDKKAKRYECAEDPMYAMEHELPINTSYYLENQMLKPLKRIFKPVYKDAESRLMHGEHTRHIVKHISLEAHTIGTFFAPRATCKACGISLTSESACHPDGLLCTACEPERLPTYMRALGHLQATQVSYARIWTNCQDCQGSRYKEVICTAQECPVFFKRMTLRRDLIRERSVAAKLGDAPSEEALEAHRRAGEALREAVRAEAQRRAAERAAAPAKAPKRKRAASNKKGPARKAPRAAPAPAAPRCADDDDIANLKLEDLGLDW